MVGTVQLIQPCSKGVIVYGPNEMARHHRVEHSQNNWMRSIFRLVFLFKI